MSYLGSSYQQVSTSRRAKGQTKHSSNTLNGLQKEKDFLETSVLNNKNISDRQKMDVLSTCSNNTILKLMLENEQQKDVIESLQQRPVQSRSRHEKLIKDLSELAESRGVRCVELKRDLDEQTHKIHYMQASIAHHEAQRKRGDSSYVEQLRKQIECLKKANEKEKIRLREKQMHCKFQSDELQACLEEHDDKIKTIQMSMEERYNRQMRAIDDQSANTIMMLNDKLQQMSHNESLSNSIIAELKQQLQDQHSLLEQREDQIQQYVKHSEKYFSRSTQRDIAQGEESNSSIQSTITGFQKELAFRERQIEELCQEREEFKQELSDMAEAYRQQESMMVEKQAYVQQLQDAENMFDEKLKAVVKEKDAVIQDLNKQCGYQKHKNEKQQKELDLLQKEIQNVKQLFEMNSIDAGAVNNSHVEVDNSERFESLENGCETSNASFFTPTAGNTSSD